MAYFIAMGVYDWILDKMAYFILYCFIHAI